MARMNPSAWDGPGSRAALGAKRPDLFVTQHLAPLLYRRTRPAPGQHETFRQEVDFWAKCRELVFGSVCLADFRITDWFPRAPGVYWSRHGVITRENTWDSDAEDDPVLGRIFSPRSKMGLIEGGGLGTIRLRPRRIDDTDCWLASAVSGSQCAGGVPLVVPDVLLREGGVDWGATATIFGQVRFINDVGLDDVDAAVHHASPVLIFVDKIESVVKRHESVGRLIITPVVLFSDGSSDHARKTRLEWGGPFGYTFVQVHDGSDSELSDAEGWLQAYALKYHGKVITNFDQQRPFLADAPLSYQRLVKKTYDRTIIENLHFSGAKLADRIDQVEQAMSISVTLGDGTVIHGDFVVANSVNDSFNRVKESSVNAELRDALARLTTQLGSLLGNLEPDTAQKAADALETLTKEVARPKPRRQWWELSLEGIKEAAASVRDIGKPIVETVGMLVPLLAAVSS